MNEFQSLLPSSEDRVDEVNKPVLVRSKAMIWMSVVVAYLLLARFFGWGWAMLILPLSIIFWIQFGSAGDTASRSAR
jgi:hypothetical protein